MAKILRKGSRFSRLHITEFGNTYPVSAILLCVLGVVIYKSVGVKSLLGGFVLAVLYLLNSTFSLEPDSHKQARSIMGRNFLGLHEVERALGPIEKERRRALAVIPFSAITLTMHAKTHVLVADTGISIVEMHRRVEPWLFESPTYGSPGTVWFDDEDFALAVGEPQWRLVRKEPVEWLADIWWRNKEELLKQDEEVPSVRQMVFVMLLAIAINEEFLFRKAFVRTSDSYPYDENPHGDRMTIRWCDGDGITIAGEIVVVTKERVCVASSVRPS